MIEPETTMQDTTQDKPSGEDANEPPRRSITRRVCLILAQIALILVFIVLVFVMWLPAIVSKK